MDSGTEENWSFFTGKGPYIGVIFRMSRGIPKTQLARDCTKKREEEKELRIMREDQFSGMLSKVGGKAEKMLLGNANHGKVGKEEFEDKMRGN